MEVEGAAHPIPLYLVPVEHKSLGPTFLSLALTAFLAVALPLTAVSVYTGTIEFGSISLELIFPSGSEGVIVQ